MRLTHPAPDAGRLCHDPQVRSFLGALALLLLVSGCSAGDGEPSSRSVASARSPTPSAPPSDPPPRPGQRLEAAQLALARAHGGVYTLRVADGFTDPFISERGIFDVQAEVINVRRTIHVAAGGSDRYVMRIRSSPRTRFLQMEGWGNWEGCWAELDRGLLADQGIDLGQLPNIPVSVSLVLDARLSPENVYAATGPVASRATVLTDGFTALQLLGFDGSTIIELPRAVARVKVPVQLSYFADYPEVVESVDILGGEVTEAFRTSDAKIPEELSTQLRSRSSSVTFAPATEPVRFERPPAKLLLPRGASPDQTCPAHPGGAQNVTLENVVGPRMPTRS